MTALGGGLEVGGEGGLGAPMAGLIFLEKSQFILLLSLEQISCLVDNNIIINYSNYISLFNPKKEF